MRQDTWFYSEQAPSSQSADRQPIGRHHRIGLAVWPALKMHQRWVIMYYLVQLKACISLVHTYLGKLLCTCTEAMDTASS